MKTIHFILTALLIESINLCGAWRHAAVRPAAAARSQAFNTLRVSLNSPIAPRSFYTSPTALRGSLLRTPRQPSYYSKMFSSKPEVPTILSPEQLKKLQELETFINTLSFKSLTDYVHSLQLGSYRRQVALESLMLRPEYNPDMLSLIEFTELKGLITKRRILEAAQELYASHKDEIERLNLTNRTKAIYNLNHWQSNLINNEVLSDIALKVYSDAFKEYLTNLYGEYTEKNVKTFLRNNNLPEPSWKNPKFDAEKILPAWNKWAQKNIPKELYKKTASVAQDIQEIIKKRNEILRRKQLAIEITSPHHHTNSPENIMFFWLHSLNKYPPAQSPSFLQSLFRWQ